MKKLISMIGAAALGVSASAGFAQERVNAFDDWPVYTANSPKECWIVSAPLSVENTRGGRKVTVNRGDILMQVTWVPDQKIVGEVSFTGGYTFVQEQAVKLQIGSSGFEMIPDGENAWPAAPDIDTQVRVAMTKGSRAIVTAVSARSGTQTKDTFSLKGFTAALNEAKERCGIA